MANNSYRTGRSGPNRKPNNQPYLYGNVVPRREQAYPQPTEPQTTEPQHRRGDRRRRRQVVRRETKMNAGYVLFLAAASIIALLVCAHYINIQSQLTYGAKQISEKRQELSQLKEENDAEESTVLNSVNLETVRDKAVNELGMVYAKPEQVIMYSNSGSDYVKQLENIPQQGVLAKSDNN